MRRIFFLFVIIVISVQQSFCSTIYTRCNGNWNDPDIWQGGIIPTTGDSIYVINSVRLTSNLVLNNNYLNVASYADICGCYSLTTNAGCNIVINGTLKINSLTNYGYMVVNGTLMTNSVDDHGNIFVYGLIMVGWNCSCSPVTNNCDPPVAAFSASDTVICEGDCINFSDHSLHNPTSWNWQFLGSGTPSSNAQNPQNICYPVQGVYDVRLIATNAQGSDTLIKHYYIKVLGRTSNTITRLACRSYLSPDGQHVWTSSGTYLDTLVNANGCDSLITIHLTILNSSNTINKSSCKEYVSPSGNYVWHISGTYTDTIPNAAGCDSIINIHLTILNSASVINKTSCYNYTSPSGNYNWTQSGIYQDTIQNTAGCDSVMTIHLTIGENTSSTIDITACERYISPGHQYTWTSTGVYYDTIPTFAGCDSLMTFNVIILHSSYSDTNITSCKSYLSPSGNYNWVNSGSYRDTIPNFFNCDSVISIDLTIESCESILFVPNIFSPNGDGQNDILFVRGEYIQEIIFRIYDRWGEKIFESNDINNGWDGNYKGKPLAVGVYTYYVKVKLNDGNDDIKKGNVSLVR